MSTAHAQCKLWGYNKYCNCSNIPLSHLVLQLKMENSTFDIRTQLFETEMKFKKACEQVVLLNDKLEGLQRRYDKARIENHRSFRYNLRLKMATVEGVRNAYYEYASGKAERIAELRYDVMQLDGDASQDDDDSDVDSDWDREEDFQEESLEEEVNGGTI